MDTNLVNSFMTEMGNLLRQAKDFTMEQVPEVCKEILRFEIASSVFFIVVAIVGLYTVRVAYKKVRENSNDTDVLILGSIYSVGVGVLSIAMLLANAFSMLKAIVAPRLYLIEYFAEIAKKVSGNGGP